MIHHKEISYEEYLERALRGKPTAHVAHRYSRKSDQPEWYGTKNWAEAAQLAEFGWSEGRELVDRITAEIKTASGPVTVKQCQWDLEGDFVDIGKFVTGEPECMMRWEDAPTNKRIARILINSFASSGVSKEMMRWKGACVLALIDKLERTGIRVQLDMGLGIKSSDRANRACYVVPLKRPEEPVHMDLLAFHLTNPSTFRRMWFSFGETDEVLSREYGFNGNGGYGYPTDIARLVPEGREYDLIVPELGLTKLEQALAALEKMFAQICPVDPYERDNTCRVNDAADMLD